MQRTNISFAAEFNHQRICTFRGVPKSYWASITCNVIPPFGVRTRTSSIRSVFGPNALRPYIRTLLCRSVRVSIIVSDPGTEIWCCECLSLGWCDITALRPRCEWRICGFAWILRWSCWTGIWFMRSVATRSEWDSETRRFLFVVTSEAMNGQPPTGYYII